MGEKPTGAEEPGVPGETSKRSNLNLSKSNINRKAAPGGGKPGGDEGTGSDIEVDAPLKPAEF